jgi:hypothetical protein
MRNPKPEIRNPKEGRNPKAESRRSKSEPGGSLLTHSAGSCFGARVSVFGFPLALGFRASGFRHPRRRA